MAELDSTWKRHFIRDKSKTKNISYIVYGSQYIHVEFDVHVGIEKMEHPFLSRVQGQSLNDILKSQDVVFSRHPFGGNFFFSRRAIQWIRNEP